MDNYSWLQLEQTKKLVKNLKDTRELLQEKLGMGETVSDTVDKTALLTAKFSGYTQSLRETEEYIKSFHREQEDADSEGEA